MYYLNQVKQFKHRAKFGNKKILFSLRDNGTVVFNLRLFHNLHLIIN